VQFICPRKRQRILLNPNQSTFPEMMRVIFVSNVMRRTLRVEWLLSLRKKSDRWTTHGKSKQRNLISRSFSEPNKRQMGMSANRVGAFLK
jgi:hypothetical protein